MEGLSIHKICMPLVTCHSDGIPMRGHLHSTIAKNRLYSHSINIFRKDGSVCFSGQRRTRIPFEVQATAGDSSGVSQKQLNEFMRGGDEVVAVMEDIRRMMEDISGFEETEEAAVAMATATVISQRLQSLDRSFLLALDFMVQESERQGDNDKQRVLEIIKDQVLAQLSQKLPPQVQVVELLSRVKEKDSRHEILIKAAAGGGKLDSAEGGKLEVPASKLDDIIHQADDLIYSMEERARVLDRRLLARLCLVREEARALMGGGILDERNNTRGFSNLPEPEVKFLATMVTMRPGPIAKKKLERVLEGMDEGQDPSADEVAALERQMALHNDHITASSSGQVDEFSSVGGKPRILPVRPGMLVDTVSKVLGGVYSSRESGGFTVQQLEWIRREALDCLQRIAFTDDINVTPQPSTFAERSKRNN